ncbi:DUF3368 domain-containing protein [Halorubrum sp. 48-1-W]|uniref:DUF3368 domain-containing protein n=1 Tax=Halorubrum sp. 48-1-W TaxID=2249761 RepID=UPI002AA2B57C|nr:DUF3368 domain-containing protein [Halorubrum sp. 48-1-W]
MTGVVGVLLRASDRGAIDLEPEVDALREAGVRSPDTPYERARDGRGARCLPRSRRDGRGPGELGRGASVHGS